MPKRILRFFFTGIGVLIAVLSLVLFYQFQSQVYKRGYSQVERGLNRELKTLGFQIKEKTVREEGFFPRHKVAKITINIPFDYPLDNLKRQINKAFFPPIKIFELKEKNLDNQYQIQVNLGFKNILTHFLKFILKKVKIAILIDDFGYSQGEAVDILLKKIAVPLTISIIPGTPYAKRIAQEAHHNKKQILIHLPMQPNGNFNNRYRWIIMEGMKDGEIKKILKSASKDVPYAVGLNNHMGSLITTRKREMEAVLRAVKEERLFFVDSRTTSSSIAYALARKMGIRSSYRQIFLDNKKEESYINGQFKKLILLARKKGWALGIGHINKVTVLTLEKLIRQLDKRKIRLVYVSQILS